MFSRCHTCSFFIVFTPIFCFHSSCGNVSVFRKQQWMMRCCSFLLEFDVSTSVCLKGNVYFFFRFWLFFVHRNWPVSISLSRHWAVLLKHCRSMQILVCCCSEPITEKMYPRLQFRFFLIGWAKMFVMFMFGIIAAMHLRQKLFCQGKMLFVQWYVTQGPSCLLTGSPLWHGCWTSNCLTIWKWIYSQRFRDLGCLNGWFCCSISSGLATAFLRIFWTWLCCFQWCIFFFQVYH